MPCPPGDSIAVTADRSPERLDVHYALMD